MGLDRHMIEIAQGLPRQAAPPRPGAQSSGEDIRRAAEDFESVFLAEMLRPMFDNLSTDAPFGGGSSERMFRTLMVEEYGKAIAKTGGVGIAETVERELLRMQEVKR